MEAIPRMFPLPPAPGVTTDFHLLTPELAKKMHLHWADLVNIALGTATIKIHEDLRVPPILIEVNPFTKVPINHSESTPSSVHHNSPVTPKRSLQTSPTEVTAKAKQRKSSQTSPASTRTTQFLQSIIQSRETVNVILNSAAQNPQEYAPIVTINPNDPDKAKLTRRRYSSLKSTIESIYNDVKDNLIKITPNKPNGDLPVIDMKLLKLLAKDRSLRAKEINIILEKTHGT